MDVEIYLEHHEFNCRHCNHVWQMPYEVHEVEDQSGHPKHFFYLTGLPAASPLAGRRCPLCGDVTAGSRMIDRRLAVPIS